MRLVLGSASPRRRELLMRLGVEFEVDPSVASERRARTGEDPSNYALSLALAKAQEVAARRPDAIVLAADTVVVLGSNILGKPTTETDAFEMLSLLSGRTHRVITAVVVRGAGQQGQGAMATEVSMARAEKDQFRAYIATGEPMDKAGAYAIQGLGGALVAGINGCYTNVVGLPLCLTSRLLQEWNIGPAQVRCEHREHALPDIEAEL